MSSSSMNIKLTVVHLDLVKSTTFTDTIEQQGGAELTRMFINQIENLVKEAFSRVHNRSEYDEFHSLGGDGYRISFQNVNNAYQFVEDFCESVKAIDNNEPNRRRRIFRVGAATGTVHFDSSQSGLRRIEGSDVLVPVSRLVQADPPGYFYVDQETFNNFNEDIKNKFENESVSVPAKNHEGTITAYRCQMFSNLDSSPITWTDETKRKLRELIQNKFTEQQLKDICTENQQTLQGNIYDLVEGTTYKSKLINLVRYLEQNGLLDKFLTILRRENPNFDFQINHLK